MVKPVELKPGHTLTFAGLYLFTVLLYFRPYELSNSLSWTSSAAFILAMLTLLVYVPTQLSLEMTWSFRPREVNLALLLILMSLLSIPMALDQTRSINATIDFAKVILIFVVMVNVVRTEKRLRMLVWLVLSASCVISGFAVNDYRLGRMTLAGERIQGVIGGIFSNPNDLALHLVMIAPIAAALLFGTRNPAARLLYTAVIGLFVFGIIATFSRGGFIGFVGVLAVFIWRAVRRYRVLVLSAGLCLVLGFLLLAPSDYFGNRISTSGDASAMARKDELKRSLFLIFRHPFFGVGINNFLLYSNNEHATHNAYTQVGSELGVAAMTIYIMLLVTTLRRIRKMHERFEGIKDSRERWFAIGLEASLIGYMISSFFLSVAYLWYVYYLVGYAICFDRITQAKLNAVSADSQYAHG